MKTGTTTIWVILAGVLLGFGLTECDGTSSSNGALNATTCDGGPEAGCPVTPDPAPPRGGW